MRASAAGAASLAAARAMPTAYGMPTGATAGAAPSALPPYVGAGSTGPVRPFQLYDVTLGNGLFQEKRDRMQSFLRMYDERRFLVFFNDMAGRPNPPGVRVPGGWEDGGQLSGHWAGHYLTALGHAYADRGEAVYKDKLDWMVGELAACQDAITARIDNPPDPGDEGPASWVPTHPGFLGANPEDLVLRLGPPRFVTYGGESGTWAPWYVQHKIVRGLLDAYNLTGNAQAFEVARKMSDWAHLALSVGDKNHPDYPGPLTEEDRNFMWDTYIAGEYGAANEPYAEVYALTGDEKHLELARFFDNRQSLFGASVENRDILNLTSETNPGPRRPDRLHANSHIPNYLGYLRIFEQTGQDEYLAAARNFFGMVVPHRSFAHGGTGGNFPGSNDNLEQFQNRGNIANALADSGAETDTAYNLMRVARNLFFHEPDAAYMDYYERGLVNQILASRADNDRTDNPQLTYFQHLGPGATRDYGNTGTCCGGSGLESHTKYTESVYFRSADGSTLWVNLYIPSTLRWAERGFTVTQETDFPRGDQTRLTIDGAGQLTLRLRVPGWAERGFEVRINGVRQDLDAAPGTYVSIPRSWRAGDRVDVSMPFSIRVERAIDRPDTQSIYWGPILMPIVGDPGDGGFRELTLYRHLKRDGDYSRAAITPDGATPAGDRLFTAQGFALRPWYIGDSRPQSAYFRRVEPQIVFGSIDSGVPNRKRDDGLPDYDVPVEGIPSPGHDGPTFLDLVWDEAPFATHGDFVAVVARLAEEFVDAGEFTTEEKDLVVAAAGRAANELAP
jgi:DUF1680 family protein